MYTTHSISLDDFILQGIFFFIRPVGYNRILYFYLFIFI